MPPLHPFFKKELSLWDGCIMLLLRLSQDISSGCHHATPTPLFGIVIMGKGIMLPLRLSQGISAGCHHATPTPIFWNCQLWEGALSFCFDLARLFLQGATMSHLHHFLDYSLWEGALCFCFDIAKYFVRVPPCHPYTHKLWICHYCGKGHYASAST